MIKKNQKFLGMLNAMKENKKIWIFVTIPVVLILAILIVVISLRSQNASAAYQTTTVQRGTLTSIVEGTGSAYAIRSANIVWQTSGQVDQVKVQIGDRVQADDVLATLALFPQQAAAALYDAQTAYDKAETHYYIERNYYGEHSTAQLYLEAKADLELAQARLDYYQRIYDSVKDESEPAYLSAAQSRAVLASIDQAALFAPFAGTITQSNLVPGEVVTSSTTAFRIDDLSQLLVDVQVSEIDINGLKVDQPVTITFDAIPDKTYDGKVVKVELAGTEGTSGVNFMVTVEVTRADELVKPGMAASVSIVTNQVSNALLIPSTAIFSLDDQQVVYLVDGNVLTPIQVTIGAVSDTSTQIINSDLQEGDVIVLSFATTGTGGGMSGFPGLGGGGIMVRGERPPEDAPAGAP